MDNSGNLIFNLNNDYQDWLPAYWLANQGAVPGTVGWWYDCISPYVGIKNGTAARKIGAKNVFQCPSDLRYGRAGVSYGMNVFISPPTNTANNSTRHKMSRAKYSSKIMLLSDTAGFAGGIKYMFDDPYAIQYAANAKPQNYGDGFAVVDFRHVNTKFNWLAVGGNVTGYSYPDLQTQYKDQRPGYGDDTSSFWSKDYGSPPWFY